MCLLTGEVQERKLMLLIDNIKKPPVFKKNRRILLQCDGEEVLYLTDVYLADTIKSRMVGLLGSNDLNPCNALLILRCAQVHTFGMKYPIDAVFIDRKGIIKKVVKMLKPNRFAGSVGSCAVLELRSGAAQKVGFERARRLTWDMAI